MAGWHWIVRDPSGAELSSSEVLPSRAEAEAWMAQEWPDLVEAGGDSATLVGNGRELYTMGLSAS